MSDTIPQDAPLKQCTRCKLFLPASTEYFFVNKKYNMGFANPCRACHSIVMREYRNTHKEQESIHIKAYLQAHKEHKKAYDKQRRQLRAKQESAYGKWYRETHPEHMRTYRKNHQKEMSVYSNNRKARKQGNGGKYTIKDVRNQYANQKGRCYYAACGHAKLGTGKGAYHVDHVIPLSRGGSNSPENLVITCPTCNLRKKDRLPHEWSEGGRLF